MSGRVGFLRPSEDDQTSTWQEDRPDLDNSRHTSFIYNSSPSLGLQSQRARLPIAKYV